MLIFMAFFNSWALCTIPVSSGLWMPTLLEGSIVLRFWGRQEGICVRTQICGDVEKVRQRGFLFESVTLMQAALVVNNYLHGNVKYYRLIQNYFKCAM